MPSEPVYGFAISVADRKDEVKLTGAIAKLVEEDPSLSLEHNQETHEMVLWGQGEMHLRVALERLPGKFGVHARSKPRHIAYKETIRRSVQVRGRHKKQSGGHGQFGDVVVEIKPLPRGEGFVFTDTITGGVVPKQYIPAVEAGVSRLYGARPARLPGGRLHRQSVGRQLSRRRFLGNGVQDGGAHRHDRGHAAMLSRCCSSRSCMSTSMCRPRRRSRVNQIVSGHRGQLLGFDARDGWPGWDTVEAHMPESEIGTLIIELRSATAGVGTFTFRHDHMAELTGRLADQVMAARKAEAA